MNQDSSAARSRDAEHGAGDCSASGVVGGNGAAARISDNGASSRITPSRGNVAVDVAATSAEPAAGGPSPARAGDGGASRADTRPGGDRPEYADSSGGDALRVHLEFDFPSDVNYIERVVSVVIRQCEEFNFPPRQCALNVPVALTEALSNAILRGNQDDRTKQVRVRAHVDQRALVMEVADEGKGFDYAASMRDPTAPENISREDGRGLYLMQRLMDRVERFTDQGNVVRLTLKRG